MDGDPVDLLGELYEQDPRWRVARLWRYERGHMSMHATAEVGHIPSRGAWFARLGTAATEWGTEAAAEAEARRLMAEHHEQARNGGMYDERGALWEERPI